MQQLMEKVLEVPREDGAFPPILYTMEGAQIASGFTRSRIYEEISAGNIEARKAGRRTLVVGDSLRAYLASLPRADIRVGSRKAA